MSKQKAIQDLQKKITQLKKSISLLKKYIPDNLPGEVDLWATEDDLRIDIPHNPKLLEQILEFLGSNWQLVRSHYSKEHAWTLNTYRHKDGINLVITLEARAVGATCQLAQSTKEIPVYEVVCV